MKKNRTHIRAKHRSKKIGLPPGSAIYLGDNDIASAAKPVISQIIYTATDYEETTINIAQLVEAKPMAGKKLWLNVHGVHDATLIKHVCENFNLHPLVMEDILNTEQRPKIDEFDDYIFLETRNFYYHPESLSVSSEQISMVLGKHFLLTFQERATGSFEPVRERLRSSHAHIREAGLDYLAYALLDSVVDKHFSVLEQMGEDSEALETSLLSGASNADLHNIHQLKHASIELRRAVWPLREVLNSLIRNERGHFSPSTLPYFRDVYDHTVSFIESLEAIRDSLGGMMDIYMTSMSNRVNLELRALTVVAMLFMPATLIAGIFGMNFDYMPWLKHHNGFWYAIAIMAGIALIMGLIFWRRQWLSSQS